MTLQGVAEWFWRGIPRNAGRAFGLFEVVLSDGAYLRAWPRVAAVAPVLALLLGFGVGSFRPISDEIFTFSVFWPLLLVIPAAFGAGLGAWAWVGFVIGDAVFFPHLSWRTDLLEHLLYERLPMVIDYEVLLGLMVLLPLAAAFLPSTITRLLPSSMPQTARAGVQIALAAGVAAMTAASWTASFLVLMHPSVLLEGGGQSPTATAPIRDGGVILIWLAAALTAARGMLQYYAGPISAGEPPAARSGPPALRGEVISAFVTALVLTLGLFSFAEDLPQLFVLFLAVSASSLLRSVALPRVRFYARVVNAVPVLIRILVMGAIGYVIGEFVLTVLNDNPPYLGLSYVPMLVTLVVSILVAAFVLPGPPLPKEPVE